MRHARRLSIFNNSPLAQGLVVVWMIILCSTRSFICYSIFDSLFLLRSTLYFVLTLYSVISPIPDIQFWKHHLTPRDPAASPVLGRASSAISHQSAVISLSLLFRSCSCFISSSSSLFTYSLSLSLPHSLLSTTSSLLHAWDEEHCLPLRLFSRLLLLLLSSSTRLAPVFRSFLKRQLVTFPPPQS